MSEDTLNGMEDEAPTVDHDPGQQTELLKLWIQQEWYIELTKQGYCHNVVQEGTVGVIVQIHHVAGALKRALKVPRLRADTLRENAYIIQILEEESKTVFEVCSADGGVLSQRMP